jgi:hypothetical protein
MSRILSRLGRLVPVLVAVLMFIVPVSGTAHAADTGSPAYLTRYLFLYKSPMSSLSAATVDRNIELDAGWYDWAFDVRVPSSGYAVPNSTAHRSIKLAAGTYHWECVLYVKDHYYTEVCYHDLPGYPRAQISSTGFNVPESGN